MKEKIYDHNERRYGFIAGMVEGIINNPSVKGERIVAEASFYEHIAEQAINGKKREREAAVLFLMQQLHNVSAMIYNHPELDLDYARKLAEEKDEKWEGSKD